MAHCLMASMIKGTKCSRIQWKKAFLSGIIDYTVKLKLKFFLLNV